MGEGDQQRCHACGTWQWPQDQGGGLFVCLGCGGTLHTRSFLANLNRMELRQHVLKRGFSHRRSLQAKSDEMIEYALTGVH